MNLHLVGGFLGSGKTTAIIGAAKYLMAKQKRVGIVTNDQGKYLVDTAFFRSEGIPTVEVTGGCFCCNYADLQVRLNQLKESVLPDVIFAESVGSCADLVATVLKPLLTLRKEGFQVESFSIFTDVRLLRQRLLNLPMPFSDKIVYLFDMQIEEAGLLVINKVDLVSDENVQSVRELVLQRFPQKKVRIQNSLQTESVNGWIELLETNSSLVPNISLEIDYERYGAGETALAWLNEEIELQFPEGKGSEAVVTLLDSIIKNIHSHNIPIGHVKFLIKGEARETKVSFPTYEDTNWKNEIPSITGKQVTVLINARVETKAEVLREIVQKVLKQMVTVTGATYVESGIEYFHPQYPNPTHRVR